MIHFIGWWDADFNWINLSRDRKLIQPNEGKNHSRGESWNSLWCKLCANQTHAIWWCKQCDLRDDIKSNWWAVAIRMDDYHFSLLMNNNRKFITQCRTWARLVDSIETTAKTTKTCQNTYGQTLEFTNDHFQQVNNRKFHPRNWCDDINDWLVDLVKLLISRLA